MTGAMGIFLQGLGWLVLARLVIGLLASFKGSRPDGELLRQAPIRRLMLHIMPTRSESTVLVEAAVDAAPLEAFLARARPQLGANLTHAVVAAAGVALAVNPRLNRFSSGGRLYSRRGRWVSFSMKRAVDPDGTVSRKAGMATVKIPMVEGEGFGALCARINGDIRLQRSGTRTAADKEYDLFDLLPTALLDLAAPLVRWLDAHNLLPRFFIDGDALFTSVFVANLGSLGMRGGFHHLFEYGNCPIFLVVGAVEERAVVRDGAVAAVRQLPLWFTYDERIEDAANARHAVEAIQRILEDPDRWLSGLDGAAPALWPREDWATSDGRFALRS